MSKKFIANLLSGLVPIWQWTNFSTYKKLIFCGRKFALKCRLDNYDVWIFAGLAKNVKNIKFWEKFLSIFSGDFQSALKA